VVHNPGERSGSGLAIISYQLVPIVQSVTASGAITNQDFVSFDVQFNMTVTGLEPSDFVINHNLGSCVASSLTGSGSSYTVVLSGCNQGEVSLTVLANSVSSEALVGPEQDFQSATVLIDSVAPEISLSEQSENEFSFETTKPIIGFELEDLIFSASSESCEITNFSRPTQKLFVAQLTGCETGYQIQIPSSVFLDEAGNRGPTESYSLVFVAQLPEPELEPEPEQESEPEAESDADPQTNQELAAEQDSESAAALPSNPPGAELPEYLESVEPPPVDPVDPVQQGGPVSANPFDLPEDSGDAFSPGSFLDSEPVAKEPLRQAAARLIVPEVKLEGASNAWLYWLVGSGGMLLAGYLVASRGRLPELITS
jgi:hypothetical protein